MDITETTLERLIRKNRRGSSFMIKEICGLYCLVSRKCCACAQLCFTITICGGSGFLDSGIS
jgi:hypothetical protein